VEKMMWLSEINLAWVISPQGANVIFAALAFWAALARKVVWPGLATGCFYLTLALV
jgi:hypothetical protein